MDHAELGDAQRQVAVALEPLVVELDVPGAIHRLDGEVVVIELGGEHAPGELVPMPRALPQRTVQQLGGLDLLVAVLLQLGYACSPRPGDRSPGPLACQKAMPGASSWKWKRSSCLPSRR